MTAEERVRDYYDTLRTGDPLPPYFVPDDSLVEFGISERLVGYAAVGASLREQTGTTADRTVASRDSRVTERDDVAWFSDDVGMAWTDVEIGTRHEFDSSWSGTLEGATSGSSSACTSARRTIRDDPVGPPGTQTSRTT